eukprot:RCo025104
MPSASPATPYPIRTPPLPSSLFPWFRVSSFILLLMSLLRCNFNQYGISLFSICFCVSLCVCAPVLSSSADWMSLVVLQLIFCPHPPPQLHCNSEDVACSPFA